MTPDPTLILRGLLGLGLGGVFGSFLSTAALRAAAGGSALAGRSRCDGCAAPIGFADMSPVVAYLVRRGRCRACGGAIAPAHVLSEAAGAVVGCLTLGLMAPAWWAPLLVATGALLFGSVFDLQTQRIPDPVNLIVGLAGAWGATLDRRLLEGLITAAMTCAILVALGEGFRRWRGRPGLGGGDVKLLSALAIWTGPLLTPIALVLASGLALAWLAATGQLRAARRLPFVPFVAAAFWPVALGRILA